MIVSHLTYHVPHSESSIVSGVPAYLKIQQLSLCQTLKKKNPTAHHVDILTSTSAGDDTTVSYKIILKYLEIHWLAARFSSVQLSSVAQPYLTLSDPMDCSTPGFPVHHQLPELTQIHVHWVGNAIQPPHLLSSPSPPAFNLSQHQGLFKWVSSLHQLAKVLEFQLQHQSFQWVLRTDFL